jgi:hypothetical protein
VIRKPKLETKPKAVYNFERRRSEKREFVSLSNK